MMTMNKNADIPFSAHDACFGKKTAPGTLEDKYKNIVESKKTTKRH
jgi:hypothetical protein